jgi:hypothetical protein
VWSEPGSGATFTMRLPLGLAAGGGEDGAGGTAGEPPPAAAEAPSA